MNTLLICYIVVELALEASVGYLLYRKRDRVRSLIQHYIGTHELISKHYAVERHLEIVRSELGETQKIVRRIRAAQRKARRQYDELVKKRSGLDAH